MSARPEGPEEYIYAMRRGVPCTIDGVGRYRLTPHRGQQPSRRRPGSPGSTPYVLGITCFFFSFPDAHLSSRSHCRFPREDIGVDSHSGCLNPRQQGDVLYKYVLPSYTQSRDTASCNSSSSAKPSSRGPHPTKRVDQSIPQVCPNLLAIAAESN